MLKRIFYSYEIISSHFHNKRNLPNSAFYQKGKHQKIIKVSLSYNHICRYVTLHCTKLKFSQYRQSFAQNYLAILVCMHIPHIGLFVQYHSNHHHQNCSLMYQHCRHRNHFLVSTKICIHWTFLERTINKLDLESSFLFRVLHNAHFLLSLDKYNCKKLGLDISRLTFVLKLPTCSLELLLNLA